MKSDPRVVDPAPRTMFAVHAHCNLLRCSSCLSQMSDQSSSGQAEAASSTITLTIKSTKHKFDVEIASTGTVKEVSQLVSLCDHVI